MAHTSPGCYKMVANKLTSLVHTAPNSLALRIRFFRIVGISSAGIQKIVLPSKTRSASGTNLIISFFAFFFVAVLARLSPVRFPSMTAIPLLLFITTEPIFGVEALRSGTGFAFDVSGGGVSPTGGVLESWNETSCRRSESFRKDGVSFTILSLVTGADVVR